MKFTKMHGCGNDYVYVDCTQEMLSEPEKTAVAVSDRHFGIGADGLILIASSQVADFQMMMYNADGSRGAMCGNGIRCVAKYVYDKGLTDRTAISVETLAGVKTLELKTRNGQVSSVRVDMGEPSFAPDRIPVVFSGAEMVKEPLEADGARYDVTCLSMGNPHCVTFLDEDVSRLDLEKIGPYFENHACFPDRINTEFVNVIDSGHLRMRVWERGSGETFACGTGACACAVAAYRNGLAGRETEVELRGGRLRISYDERSGHVFMTGPAVTVFEGEWNG